jgi:hypothetical protein
MPTRDEAMAFYGSHYDILGDWLITPGCKITLGDKKNRVCRFCKKRPPDVTFQHVAHVIPESLGNKNFESAYECDTCNQIFGDGIENELGNWSMPMRTFARIRGKRGVPALKRGSDGLGSRIEYGDTGFKVTVNAGDPIHHVDETEKKITFKLKRDPYVPIAVLKAFIKIGLSLLPDQEVENFSHLMAWLQDINHTSICAKQNKIIYTVQPGYMPNDRIMTFICRRKSHIVGYPFIFFVLAYGNEMFQVQLPSEKYDAEINWYDITNFPFPHPASREADRFGHSYQRLLDLTGLEKVYGEEVLIIFSYEQSSRRPQESPSQ